MAGLLAPWPLAGLLLVASACRGPQDRVGPTTSPDSRAVPGLAEIFRKPGLQGVAPRALSLSADGRWILLRWGSPAAEPAEDPMTLRLMAVHSPGTSGHRGVPLLSLLPLPEFPPTAADTDVGALPSGPWQLEGMQLAQPDDAVPPVVCAWSERGARLAIGRGEDIFLADAPARGDGEWRVRQLVAGSRRQTPAGRTLGRLHSLAFGRADRELRIVAGEELWLAPLVDPSAPFEPLAIGQLDCRTAEVESTAVGLSWSDDRRIAFRADPPPAWIEALAEDSAGGASVAQPRAPAQVVDVETGERRTLAAMDTIEWLEGAELSPDGRYVFAEELDRSTDPAPQLVPDFLTTRVSTRDARRRRADDLPPPRRLWIWSTATGMRTELIVPGGERYNLRRVGWAPQREAGAPARFAFVRRDSEHKRSDAWCWSEGSLSHLATDTDERWLGGPTREMVWSRDGRLLIFGSETFVASRSRGHNQLFALDPDTRQVRQLTDVDGEVSEFRTLESGAIVFGYTPREQPELRRLAWLSPADVRVGTETSRAPRAVGIAAPPGLQHALVAAADANVVAFRHATLGEPAELWAATVAAAREEARSDARAWPLTDTVPVEFRAVDWIRPALFEVASERGARVRSHVFLPRATTLDQPDRARPAIVFMHGAGYLQNVTASLTEYEVNFLFHSRLAMLGYVVVDVDYRGSKGYGRDFRTDVQFQLGGLELRDIDATVDALVQRGVIDGARVACYGGSYGGFLTLMALFTAPERWAGGSALRPVTDWRSYHPDYAQPRLGRPSTHPDAYERSSPIDHAQGLEDPLLILHGLLDSNVFAQDSIRLIEKLIDLGREFDAMLYPSQGHTFSDGAHWLDEYRRVEAFLTECLGPP